MISLHSALQEHDPRRIGVLFIDLQHHWANKRSKRQLPHIARFSKQLAGLAVKQIWVGHDIGQRFEEPRDISACCPEQDFAHLSGPRASSRFLYNLRDMTGVIVNKSEPNAFSNPLLAEYLRWSDVDFVLGCGYIASQCVAATLIGGRRHGFKVGMINNLSIDNRRLGDMRSKRRMFIVHNKLSLIHSDAVLGAIEMRAARDVIPLFSPAPAQPVMPAMPKVTDQMELVAALG